MKSSLTKLPVFVFLFAIVWLGCDHRGDVTPGVCSSVDPVIEVPWVMDLKNSMTNCSCELGLIRGTYKGQTVIFVALIDPVCNGINTPTLFSCTGEVIRTFTDSPADQKELREKVTFDTVLYRCKT